MSWTSSAGCLPPGGSISRAGAVGREQPAASEPGASAGSADVEMKIAASELDKAEFNSWLYCLLAVTSDSLVGIT